MTTEDKRLGEASEQKSPWKKWGPYLSERQWGTVREDYSEGGDAWNYFTHAWLGGRTPDEVYHTLPPANEQPRVESRARWPARSTCAQPRAPVDGEAGAIVELDVSHVAGRKHLPIVMLRRVA